MPRWSLNGVGTRVVSTIASIVLGYAWYCRRMSTNKSYINFFPFLETKKEKKKQDKKNNIKKKKYNAIPSWKTGELIRISAGKQTLKIIVERRLRGGQTSVAIALPNNPYGRLRVFYEDTFLVDWAGVGDGKNTAWDIDNVSSQMTHIRMTLKKKGSRQTLFLIAGNNGLEVTENVQDHHTALWCVQALTHSSEVPQMKAQWDMEPFINATSTTLHVNLLNENQLISFVQDGFLLVRNILPTHVLKCAQVAINSRLGRPGGITNFFQSNDPRVRRLPSGHNDVHLPLDPTAIDDGIGDSGKVGRISEMASHDPSLLFTARCPEVARLIAQLIGPGKVMDISGVQCALRFPGCIDALVASGSAMKDRISGTDWHTDGLRQGKKHSFSLLVGIALTDMPIPNIGNLCVWPGSHLRIHRWMRHPDGKVIRSNGGYSDSDGPLPNLGPPTQLKMMAGDVVFAHSETGHCGGPHLDSSIRSMLYFRVRHIDWKQMCKEGRLVKDMWCDLEGVQHLESAKCTKEGRD